MDTGTDTGMIVALHSPSQNNCLTSQESMSWANGLPYSSLGESIFKIQSEDGQSDWWTGLTWQVPQLPSLQQIQWPLSSLHYPYPVVKHCSWLFSWVVFWPSLLQLILLSHSSFAQAPLLHCTSFIIWLKYCCKPAVIHKQEAWCHVRKKFLGKPSNAYKPISTANKLLVSC